MMHKRLRQSVVIGVTGLGCVLIWGFRACPVDPLAEARALYDVRQAEPNAATTPIILHVGGASPQHGVMLDADDRDALADVMGIGSQARRGPDPMSYTPSPRVVIPPQPESASDIDGFSGFLDDDRAGDDAFEGVDEALPKSWGWLADDVGETRRDANGSSFDDRAGDAPPRLFEDDNDDGFRSRFGVGGQSDDASYFRRGRDRF